ncbi:MAG: hypothetical protein HYZ15_06530 [Sphingobacteriales bacterium]|nr:hypothetical protein [Sphingobacteriales bacterium]
MFRRSFGLLIFVLVFGRVQGQLSLSLQEPPAGIVQKSQLWNLALIYSGNSSINVTIGVTLVDSKNDQPVLTAKTAPVTLVKGVKQLKSTDVAPITYDYYSPALSRLSDALIPVGYYRACYTIYGEDRAHGEVLAEDCINIEVIPLSPPQLSLPEDASKIQTPYPQFSWMPPAPVTLFTDLNYELLLTEVREGQTVESAIQENLPVYRSPRLTSMAVNYPVSGRQLDTGKVYAWRVVAKNGDAFASQSEVWTFKVGPEKQQVIVPSGGIYYELKPSGNYGGTGLLPDRVLGIKYYSYDKTRPVVLSIVDESGKLVKEYSRTAEYGNNFWVIELNKAFSSSVTYRVIIADLQGTVYSASFKIQE